MPNKPTHSPADIHLGAPPPNLFFATPAQRLALARQRFFEDGVRPTGLVADPVIQSWIRCLQARRQPEESVSFEPVTRSRISSTLERNRLLLRAAHDELGQLETTLAGTACKAILTDAHGIVVHATHSQRHQGALMWLAGRVGVDLAEDCVGTTAPGVVAKSGHAVLVQAGEHFFDQTRVLYCAAAPIRGVRGELLGVLDLSCEARPFGFDAASVVQLCATAIENRLLHAQSTQQLLVRFQTGEPLLHTPLEGLAGIDEHARVAWINAAGERLLFGARERSSTLFAEECFGLSLAQLLRVADSGRVHRQLMPNGLVLCLAVQMHGGDRTPRSPLVDAQRAELSVPAAVSAVNSLAEDSVAELAGAVALPAGSARQAGTQAEAHAASAGVDPTAGHASASLNDASRELIARTLAAHGGNVSRTARKLGVSRGLVYRRMRQGGTLPPG